MFIILIRIVLSLKIRDLSSRYIIEVHQQCFYRDFYFICFTIFKILLHNITDFLNLLRILIFYCCVLFSFVTRIQRNNSQLDLFIVILNVMDFLPYFLHILVNYSSSFVLDEVFSHFHMSKLLRGIHSLFSIQSLA